MNARLLRLPLAALVLLAVASCDVQESTSPAEPMSVVLAPRLAAGKALPHADSVSIRLHAEDGLVDTSQIVGNIPGQKITLGTLPPGVRFTITMSGFETPSAGARVTTWWTSVRDSSGSSAVHEVSLGIPQRSPAPTESFSRIADSSIRIVGADTVLFQGKPIKLPAGTWITTNGGDPRIDASARLVDTSYVTDSVNTIKLAVKVDSNPVTGSPVMWSPVKTFALAVDPLDSLTALDTLMMTSWRSWSDSIDTEVDTNDVNHSDSINEDGVRRSPFLPDDSSRTDTLLASFGNDPLSVDMHCYVVPGSPRAKIRVGAQQIPPDSFVKIPFPADSTVEVVVENHRRSRTYKVRFVNGMRSVLYQKNLNGLESTSPGLVHSTLSPKVYSILLPIGQDSLVLIPSLPPDNFARIRDTLWGDGDSIPLHVGPGISSVLIDIVHGATDSAPVRYELKIERPLQLTFRDTTYGTPWRDVPYDTLVYNSRKYRTVVVGSARWMAENLNFKVDSSFCAHAVVDSCAKYARLYTWSGAADTTPRFDSTGIPSTGRLQGVCPAGWHLPSTEEWQALFDLVGSVRAGILLRSHGNSWIAGGGQDSVGLRILPAGFRQNRNTGEATIPTGVGNDGWFWTSSQGPTASQASAVHFSGTSTQVKTSPQYKVHALSVRCVSDTAVVAP